MYLGGRFVLGSGNCCPQDFLFFTGFFSGAGVPAMLPSITESPNMLSSSNDCGVMASFGFMACSAKSDGYEVPGVETKLSARLSAGECSNLMRGVDDIVNRVTRCVCFRIILCDTWRGM